jgi:superfamily I DNA/RNA helicase
MLAEVLDELQRDGFSPSALAVLSTRTPSSSAAAQVTSPPWKDRLRPIGSATGKQVGYTSVHAFKGLEAGAVIVTDIEGISQAADIFYIAVTRALHRLVLLIDARAKQDVLNILLKGLAQTSTV